MDVQQPSERWQQIQSILDDVFELPTEQRLARLQQACEDEPDLYQEVATLLKAEADAPAFLERPALELARSLLSTATSSHRAQIPDYTDRCIGPYRLRDEIGRGGMGVVYRADRTEGDFDQQVAIKLLWNGQDREMRLDRFQREQQLLASLNHPNIAQLYDGGLTKEGQPFIVMEHVQGEPINAYCDRHRLTIDARLKLTLQVVDALHYAHRNLVIHRDIKPSNILVSEDGQVKLLDFGIAKLLGDQTEPECPAAIDLTHTGEQLMTPGFAAPEQLLGQNVTVATDVFQLGLVLYELLTGRHAFRERAGSFYELARNICEQTPTRPSVIVNQQGDSNDNCSRSNGTKQPVEKLSEARGVQPAQWRKKLNGDLDAIVLKALRNEPEMRYASMEALRADIQAYFEARPVEAREESVRYRLSKFVRRNTWAVMAGFSIGALVIAYAATVTVQASRIQSALNQSRVEAHKAQQVSDFVIDIFKVSDPNISGIETVTARELLEKGRQRAHKELSGVPEIQAQMLYVLGEIYFSLGSYEESASLLEGALRIYRELLPKQDPVLADTLIRLGMAYEITERYKKARTLFEEALSIYDSRGIENAEKGEALNTMGSVLKKLGDYEQARIYFEQAINLLRRVTDGKHYELAVALNNLAALQSQEAEFVAAERNMREAVTLQENILGSEHSYFSLTLNNLAAILTQTENYEEAEPLHRRALSLQENSLGRNHPFVAYTLWTLGTLMQKKGNLEQAEDYFRRAISIHDSAHGRQSVAVASGLSRLGVVLQDQGRYEEAGLALEETLNIDVALLPANNPKLGRDYYRLASLAHATGDLVLARTRYRKALEILPASNKHNSYAKLGYSRLLLDLGELNEAALTARAALKTRRSKYPIDHSLTAEAQSVLGRILLQMGEDAGARKLLAPAYQILNKRRSKHDPALLETSAALSLEVSGHKTGTD